MNHESRFIIGIDLGTTHCALAYLDTYAADPRPVSLDIPQWDGDEGIVRRPTLPSFLYLPTKSERKRESKTLPFQNPESASESWLIGREARDHLADNPGRVVHSAKSWLCHGGVNRTAPILPWQSEDILGDQRLSPVRAATLLLEYLRDVWNDHINASENPEQALAHQKVFVTVPASFDEVAQKLTLTGAQAAGYPSTLRLIEEPQAAFFDWYLQSDEAVTELVSSPQGPTSGCKHVLVCDIGGGTSDFSLLEVSINEGDSTPQIKRTRVSNHILLGGDNIDLAIAHLIEQKRQNASALLRADPWLKLLAQARQIKEKVLNETVSPDDELHVAIGGRGASLFDSTETISLAAKEVASLIYDGFYPQCPGTAEPQQKSQMGLSEWGLPYAQDTAITRHLAHFLRQEPIDAVLFAGGSLNSERLRQHLGEILQTWQTQPIRELKASSLDLTIARGATAYAWLKDHSETRIVANYPRAVFLKVQHGANAQLLRLIPRNSPLGSRFHVDSTDLEAVVNQQVSFEIWVSPTDQGQTIGELVPIRGDAHSLAPLQTTLTYPDHKESQLKIALIAEITETGMLRLACIDRDQPTTRWDLEFSLSQAEGSSQLQAATAGSDTDATPLPAEQLAQVETIIRDVFGKKKGQQSAPNHRPGEVAAELERVLHKPRQEWSVVELRQIWDILKTGMTRRARSPEHEATWLNLAGFTLRPGFGAARDPERMEQMWNCYQMGMAHPKEARVQDQWWIAWRRVAGGLSAERQTLIFDKIFPQIRKKEGADASREMILLAGALERVEMNRRIQLGRTLSKQIASGRKEQLDAKAWALGRVSSRIPLYSGADAIVPPGLVEDWLDSLAALNPRQKHYRQLVHVFSLAGRRVEQRDFDLAPQYRDLCLHKLHEAKADSPMIEPVEQFIPPDRGLYDELFGEALPLGIRLRN
jgi:molecular chaperone DnaK (HSP70)